MTILNLSEEVLGKATEAHLQSCEYLFKIRRRLPQLIDDIWDWETVEDQLHASQRTRCQALQDAMQAFLVQNGFMGVPALCVQSVQAHC